MHNLSDIEMQFSVCMPTSGSSMGRAGTGLGWVLYLDHSGGQLLYLDCSGGQGALQVQEGQDH